MENELKRLIELLSQTNPLSEDYEKICRRIDDVARLARFIRDVEPRRPIQIIEEAKHIAAGPKPIEEPTPVEEPAPVEEPTPVVEPTSTPEPEEPEPLPEIPENPTKEDMRAALTDLQSNGFLVKTFISKYVPEGSDLKFSNIPKEKYKEAIADIRKQIAEKEKSNAG